MSLENWTLTNAVILFVACIRIIAENRVLFDNGKANIFSIPVISPPRRLFTNSRVARYTYLNNFIAERLQIIMFVLVITLWEIILNQFARLRTWKRYSKTLQLGGLCLLKIKNSLALLIQKRALYTYITHQWTRGALQPASRVYQ